MKELADTVTFPVSQAHIDEGQCFSAGRCAVALAFADHVKGANVLVDGRHVYIYDGTAEDKNIWRVYLLDNEGQRWVSNFDRAKDVEPAVLTMHRDEREYEAVLDNARAHAEESVSVPSH